MKNVISIPQKGKLIMAVLSASLFMACSQQLEEEVTTTSLTDQKMTYGGLVTEDDIIIWNYEEVHANAGEMTGDVTWEGVIQDDLIIFKTTLTVHDDMIKELTVQQGAQQKDYFVFEDNLIMKYVFEDHVIFRDEEKDEIMLRWVKTDDTIYLEWVLEDEIIITKAYIIIEDELMLTQVPNPKAPFDTRLEVTGDNGLNVLQVSLFSNEKTTFPSSLVVSEGEGGLVQLSLAQKMGLSAVYTGMISKTFPEKAATRLDVRNEDMILMSGYFTITEDIL